MISVHAKQEKEMCRCGTEESGLVVDLVVLGLQLNSLILKVFSNLNDSTVL